MDKEHPLLCPYYIASKQFVPAETMGVRMVPSTALRTRAERVIQHPVPPRELGEMCGECCPYELMMQAARTADVIILNYHHLFDREIREQLYANLGIEPQDVLLLIDEAHNCGDTITDIMTVTMEQRDLEQASRELAGMRGRHKGAEAVRHVLPRLTEFMKGLESSAETEDWFDPAIFDRMIVRESLYKAMDEIVDDLLGIAESIREKNQKAGQFRETAIERLTEFLFRLSQSATDPAYLTLYRKGEAGITLEVRNIDPAAALTEVCAAHACAVLISGTLSPVESFRKFYFSDLPVTTLSLPNAFPKENRIVAVATDITTAYSMRQNRENTTKVTDYIRAFSALNGNRAIYFPSYQILESYADLAAPYLQGRKVFIEPRDTADASAALSAFLSLPLRGESGVMFAVCGGKWSEGLDYRGEMLNGAMVVGLPLAPFNRVRRMMIDYFRHKFGAEGEFLCYTLPAINRSLQALGRVLRTPEDKGVLVLAEKRFLENRVRSALPGWIQDEMIACDAKGFREVIAQWK
jgi:DNA excision repair protein ERCC-2